MKKRVTLCHRIFRIGSNRLRYFWRCRLHRRCYFWHCFLGWNLQGLRHCLTRAYQTKTCCDEFTRLQRYGKTNLLTNLRCLQKYIKRLQNQEQFITHKCALHGDSLRLNLIANQCGIALIRYACCGLMQIKHALICWAKNSEGGVRFTRGVRLGDALFWPQGPPLKSGLREHKTG